MNIPSDALWKAFKAGRRYVTENGQTGPTRVEDAGVLTLPTGEIVVSDPLLDPYQKPLSIDVPPGSYPVLIAFIENRVALILVRISERTPVRWRQPKPEAFSTDSATGCVMDRRICRFLRRKAEAGTYERYCRKFENALAENNGLWGSHSFDSATGSNVFLFGTYDGDGTFPLFFGYDADGELVCLAIDMFLHMEHVLEPVDKG